MKKCQTFRGTDCKIKVFGDSCCIATKKLVHLTLNGAVLSKGQFYSAKEELTKNIKDRS